MITRSSIFAYICLSALPIYAVTTYTETVNGITWTYTVENGEASVGGGSYSSPAVPRSTSGAITIPSTLSGNIVTGIGDFAFGKCSGLTSVTIPNSVTSIGDYTFYGCSNLTHVTIPDDVTSIGSSAFDGVPFYENQPDGLVVFGKVAYKLKGNCPASVTIPDGVTSIGNSAFYNYSGLTSVTIPVGVTSIGSSAFYGCSGLTSMSILDGVTSIGSYAFYDCTNLTHVTIPGSVTNIEYEAFDHCSNLSDVYINDLAAWCKMSVAGFWANPLSYAHNLHVNGELITELIIPEGVTSIRDYAFCNCTNLTHVTIPDSVTSKFVI